MLLADILAQFEDPAFAGEALFMLDDLALTARIHAEAADNGQSPGEIAMQCIARFANTAADEEWLALMGLMSRTDNPGQAFLRHILTKTLAAPVSFR